MALVPALDLRDPDPRPTHPPANVEAEQALLGCVLFDNAAYERVSDGFRGDHFFEPFHQRLWALVAAGIAAGKLVDPVLLADKLGSDKAFEELGGVRYLADLIDRAPPAPSARDYSDAITDLWRRRQVLGLAQSLEVLAYRNTDDDGEEIDGRKLVEYAERELYGLGETSGSQGFSTFSDALSRAVAQVAAAAGRDGGVSGLSTGLTDVDGMTGGLHPSDLVILAARPGMGKTTLATNIAFNVASRYAWHVGEDGQRVVDSGGVVAFFSLEMSDEQLALRVLSEVSGVPGDDMRKGKIDSNAYGRIVDAAQAIANSPLYIDSTGGNPISRIRNRARRLKRTVGLDLVVVDYLQLADGEVKWGGNRTQEVGNITGGLKALAKELGVPVVALSQLSRQVENREDKKPQLSDLRESGSIEQDADMVWFLYRESYYLAWKEPKEHTDEHLMWQEQMDACRHTADLIVGKQRHGPVGTVKLGYSDKTSKFTDLATGRHVAQAQAAIDFTQPRGAQ